MLFSHDFRHQTPPRVVFNHIRPIWWHNVVLCALQNRLLSQKRPKIVNLTRYLLRNLNFLPLWQHPNAFLSSPLSSAWNSRLETLFWPSKSDHKRSPERLFAAKMTIFRTKHNFLRILHSPLVKYSTQTVPNHREMIDFIITFQVVLKKFQKNQ